MSDYLYSSVPVPAGQLTKQIQGIYHQDPVEVSEFHGDWGSLAISESRYKGFQPVETERFILAVIGGPVLCWRDNSFLVGKDSEEGTRAVFERWQSGQAQWDEDLSGAFVILAIDKSIGRIHVITDLLMFIPVYECNLNGSLFLGTHVDAMAEAAGQNREFDLVSLADFVLNSAIAYPYTAYTQIKQGVPACDFTYHVVAEKLESSQGNAYWQPLEDNEFANIDEAAAATLAGMRDYVDRVTEKMTDVAQFISGGEDTRAVSGLLPERLNRKAFVFLDSMNREGRIAEKAAKAYGAEFHPEFRSAAHYLDILPEAAALIGAGYPFGHAHTLRFDKICKLKDYSAVFGGYLSDSFLKGLYSNKPKIVKRFTFVPEFLSAGELRSKSMENGCFADSVLEEITSRRRAHFESIKKIRPNSAHEWFALFPATMMITIPNVYVNRRLFRSYEPFMCKQVVKIGAAVPVEWKLNRRLFNKITKSIFRKTRWVSHTEGHLPYFPWWVNMPIQFVNWARLYIGKRAGLLDTAQGPWADWQKIVEIPEWKNSIESYQDGFEAFQSAFRTDQLNTVFESRELNVIQKMYLLQTLWNLKQARFNSG